MCPKGSGIVIKVVINGKLYDRISEAHVVADGFCYIIYDDENGERNILHFRNEELDEWIITISK